MQFPSRRQAYFSLHTSYAKRTSTLFVINVFKYIFVQLVSFFKEVFFCETRHNNFRSRCFLYANYIPMYIPCIRLQHTQFFPAKNLFSL